MATPYDVHAKVAYYAQKWAVNAEHIEKVVMCESQGSTTLQSLAYAKDGTREDSWGIAQINLPAHEKDGITKEMALDPDFSLNWMASQWKQGNAHLWTCWRNYEKEGW